MTGLDLHALSEAIDRHGRIARAVIVDHRGSTPRETGTSMLVWPNGQSGTIGGGALEFAVADDARRLLDGSGNRRLLRIPLGPGIGQCCGGSLSVAIEVFDGDCLPALEGSDSNDGPGVPVFAREFDQGDGGCGSAGSGSAAPRRVRRRIRDIRSGAAPPRLAWVDGWLVEPLTRPEREIWIYGAGHVGRALVATLSDLPFALTWVDINRERFPADIDASVRVLVTCGETASHVDRAPDRADHLVLTHSHALDLDICDKILRRPFRSLGLIGSRTKRRRFAGRLRVLGHDDDTIARLTCPIGIPELGKHPRNIAIGVAVTLLKGDGPGDGSGGATG
ncbi:MAG: xanthine dehydrogenase accessory protein XdhC [Paracoccaceae bacterium]|nr:xanthine dehydrogenase accessory protein XdhC [Paracoccaceae bacterium]